MRSPSEEMYFERWKLYAYSNEDGSVPSAFLGGMTSLILRVKVIFEDSAKRDGQGYVLSVQAHGVRRGRGG